jgi:phage terminase large subunit
MIDEAAVRQMRSWREPGRGILRFVSDNFGVTLDPWQEQALEALGGPEQRLRVSMQACAGPGKSAVLTWFGWWFLGTQGAAGEFPKGAMTSVTGENLRNNGWAEFSKWQGRSPYLSRAFTWTSTRIFATAYPESWFLSAVSWPKSAAPEELGKTFSGLHAAHVLVLIDESGAIPGAILRAAEQALSVCTFGRIVQAGNPISLDGMLHDAATRLRHQWTVIRVTGDPEDPNAWVHSPRVGAGPKEWAEEQIRTYGRDNPWVRSYILGQFPTQAINSLLSVEDVEAAMARRLPEDAWRHAQQRLGIDVARFGDDRTVIFPRRGLLAGMPTVLRHARGSAVSVEIASHVLALKAQLRSELEVIDATGGWGAGTADVLTSNGFPPLNTQFHAPAFDARFANRRAELHWKLAEAVRAGLQLPDLPELVAELTSPTYSFQRGQILIEPKEHVKKRIGRSPDLADALALTYALDDMPAELIAGADAWGHGRVLSDWNPFELDQTAEQDRRRREHRYGW